MGLEAVPVSGSSDRSKNKWFVSGVFGATPQTITTMPWPGHTGPKPNNQMGCRCFRNRDGAISPTQCKATRLANEGVEGGSADHSGW